MGGGCAPRTLFICLFVYFHAGDGVSLAAPRSGRGARGRAGQGRSLRGLQFPLAPPGVAGRSRKQRPRGGRRELRHPSGARPALGMRPRPAGGSDMDDGGG